MQCTTKQLAEQLGVEYAVAQGLIRFLGQKGYAKIVGVRPNPRGKGKGSDIWEIPAQVTLNLAPAIEEVA